MSTHFHLLNMVRSIQHISPEAPLTSVMCTFKNQILIFRYMWGQKKNRKKKRNYITSIIAHQVSQFVETLDSVESPGPNSELVRSSLHESKKVLGVLL